MSFSRGIHITLIVLFYLAGKSVTRAQLAYSAIDSSIQNAKEIYFAAKGRNSGLYSGYRYKTRIVHRRDVGHPFLISEGWKRGSIEYDGVNYANVSLMYDVVYDKIVVQNAYNFLKIELINERVSSFFMRGHNFVNLSHQNTSGSSIPQPGFYDLLYDGEVKVYAKRRKEAIKKLESGITVTKFNTIDKYFIYKGGKYFPVKSKSSVLNVFDDQKAELKKYLSKNKIRFNKYRESAMIELARFYDDTTE